MSKKENIAKEEISSPSFKAAKDQTTIIIIG